MFRYMVLGGAVVALCGLATSWHVMAGEKPPAKPAANVAETPTTPAAEPAARQAVVPKPVSEEVKKGVGWLVEHQLNGGGWGQGEESTQMGGGGQLKDVASVADTCMVALALIRADNTPAQGEYAGNVLRAVEFICGEIEESDKDSLYITATRGTRVQSKLGPYIDTFTAAVLLPEVKDRMPDEAGKKRVAAAIDKLMAKIQKNQKADGTWGGQGWATTIQQGMAVKGMNRAAQFGAKVDEKVRARAEKQARDSFDKASGSFSAEGSAGVQLYSAGSNLGSVAESVKTNRQQKGALEDKLASPAASPAEKAEARATLNRFKEAEKDLDDAQDAVIARMDDKQFIAGFGSNGGEEFLSYMNIGESLVLKGGDAWKAWDKSISENLYRVQNNDGSWSGHHCITGRTFCTSAALLVLMVDRAPQPLSEKMRQR
ncbi:MAG: hypothetical protein U1E05_14695 [Patescibacteria group bacterium]|nr:hypothetical protein [Patescibacteria group bacterium]